MRDLVIFGIGDVARLAHFYFDKDTDHRVVAFSVDASYRKADEFSGLPLVDFETVEEKYPPSKADLFVAIGYNRMNRNRAEKYAEAKAKGYTLPSYVSPRCSYLAQTPPGDNCLIMEDNTIQPFVRIGNDVILWSGNHIGHDAVIGDHCFITSHVVVSGHVQVGPYCFLGVNATLRNSITLAEGTLVGAGATLLKDTEEHGVYVPPKSELLRKSSFDVKI